MRRTTTLAPVVVFLCSAALGCFPSLKTERIRADQTMGVVVVGGMFHYDSDEARRTSEHIQIKVSEDGFVAIPFDETFRERAAQLVARKLGPKVSARLITPDVGPEPLRQLSRDAHIAASGPSTLNWRRRDGEALPDPFPALKAAGIDYLVVYNFPNGDPVLFWTDGELGTVRFMYGVIVIYDTADGSLLHREFPHLTLPQDVPVRKDEVAPCHYFPLDAAGTPPDAVLVRRAELLEGCEFGVLEAATFTFMERDLDAYLKKLPDLAPATTAP